MTTDNRLAWHWIFTILACCFGKTGGQSKQFRGSLYRNEWVLPDKRRAETSVSKTSYVYIYVRSQRGHRQTCKRPAGRRGNNNNNYYKGFKMFVGMESTWKQSTRPDVGGGGGELDVCEAYQRRFSRGISVCLSRSSRPTRPTIRVKNADGCLFCALYNRLVSRSQPPLANTLTGIHIRTVCTKVQKRDTEGRDKPSRIKRKSMDREGVSP